METAEAQPQPRFEIVDSIVVNSNDADILNLPASHRVRGGQFRPGIPSHIYKLSDGGQVLFRSEDVERGHYNIKDPLLGNQEKLEELAAEIKQQREGFAALPGLEQEAITSNPNSPQAKGFRNFLGQRELERQFTILDGLRKQGK